MDENMPHRAIRRIMDAQAPDIRCWVISEHPAPPIDAPDPDLLNWIEANDCILATRNHVSMPAHLQDHLAQGRHVPGILVMKSRLAPWQMAEELILIWGASLADEYADQIVYWPRT